MRRPRSERDVTDRLNLLTDGMASGNEAVELIAERLLHGLTTPPTRLEDLFAPLQVHGAQPIANLRAAGELRRQRNGYRIVYSAGMPRTRERFTIAHELGHAILNLSSSHPPVQGVALERVCDRFAAALLMPRDKFKAATTELPTVARLIEAARSFEVSVQAAAVRMEQISDTMAFCIDGRNVVWKTHAVPTQDPTLRDAVAAWLRGNRRIPAFFLITKRGPGYWSLEGAQTEDGTVFLLQRATPPQIEARRLPPHE